MNPPPTVTDADDTSGEHLHSNVGGQRPAHRHPSDAGARFLHVGAAKRGRGLQPPDDDRQGRDYRRQSPSTGWNRESSSAPASGVRLRQPSSSPAPQWQGTSREQRQMAAAKPGRRLGGVRWWAEVTKQTRERINKFWSKNKGLTQVFVSQFFGTLMNVTTRVLEREGNEGRGLHPFQVRNQQLGRTRRGKLVVHSDDYRYCSRECPSHSSWLRFTCGGGRRSISRLA